MPRALDWTAERDALIGRLRAEGATWDQVAARLGVSRTAALERAKLLRRGDAPVARPARAAAKAVEENVDRDRAPLAPGHPVAWGLLTAGTCLAGTAFPREP